MFHRCRSVSDGVITLVWPLECIRSTDCFAACRDAAISTGASEVRVNRLCVKWRTVAAAALPGGAAGPLEAMPLADASILTSERLFDLLLDLEEQLVRDEMDKLVQPPPRIKNAYCSSILSTF